MLIMKPTKIDLKGRILIPKQVREENYIMIVVGKIILLIPENYTVEELRELEKVSSKISTFLEVGEAWSKKNSL